MNGKNLKSEDSVQYTDESSISEWAREAVSYCYAQNIMRGNDNNEFRPLADITRAEAAAVLQRCFKAE